MKKVFLSAGHYPQRKGASHKGFYEHDEAIVWVKKLECMLSCLCDVEIVPTGTLRQKVKHMNKQKYDLAVEVHFNSLASGRAYGSETLHYPGSKKGKKCAKEIQKRLAEVFKPDRGIKEGWYRMDRPGVKDYQGDVEGDETIDYFLRKTKGTALILEPEFIQHKGKIQMNRTKGCMAIAKGIIDALDLKND